MVKFERIVDVVTIVVLVVSTIVEVLELCERLKDLREFHEKDKPLKMPKRYQRWSDEKIEQELRKREYLAKSKNSSTRPGERLDLDYKVNL